MKDKTFIVVFDDEQGLCIPYGWDEECDGALSAICGKDTVACFGSRKTARAAINISCAFAKLEKIQGKNACEDFLVSKRNVRVLECKSRNGA